VCRSYSTVVGRMCRHKDDVKLFVRDAGCEDVNGIELTVACNDFSREYLHCELMEWVLVEIWVVAS
jgi:hypothetical protein